MPLRQAHCLTTVSSETVVRQFASEKTAMGVFRGQGWNGGRQL